MLNLRFSQRFLTAESNFQAPVLPVILLFLGRGQGQTSHALPVSLSKWLACTAPSRFTSRGALSLHSLPCCCNDAEMREDGGDTELKDPKMLSYYSEHSFMERPGIYNRLPPPKAVLLFGIMSQKYIQQLSETRLYFMFLFITIHDVILELHNIPAK